MANALVEAALRGAVYSSVFAGAWGGYGPARDLCEAMKLELPSGQRTRAIARGRASALADLGLPGGKRETAFEFEERVLLMTGQTLASMPLAKDIRGPIALSDGRHVVVDVSEEDAEIALYERVKL